MHVYRAMMDLPPWFKVHKKVLEPCYLQLIQWPQEDDPGKKNINLSIT